MRRIKPLWEYLNRPRPVLKPETKQCTKCWQIKPLAMFHKKKKGQVPLCRECKSKYDREYYNKPEVKARVKSYQREYRKRPHAIAKEHKRNLRRHHDITPEDYDQMVEEQNGKCAICGTMEPGGRNKHLAVDHNHTTGENRGLLCSNCNAGIGMLDDDPIIVQKAADYLKKHAGATN